VKKFELSHNRSLDGMVNEIRSDMLVDGVAVPLEDDNEGELANDLDLPGAGKGNIKNDGSRSTKAEMLTAAVGFSSTGHEWAAATTQGLQIFSLDEGLLFAPTDLDISITPQSVAAAIVRQEYTLAINMALHLGEPRILKKAVDAVDAMAISLVVMTIDLRMLKRLMSFLAEELVRASPSVEPVLLLLLLPYVIVNMNCTTALFCRYFLHFFFSSVNIPITTTTLLFVSMYLSPLSRVLSSPLLSHVSSLLCLAPPHRTPPDTWSSTSGGAGPCCPPTASSCRVQRGRHTSRASVL
jgi:hypothetical protein